MYQLNGFLNPYRFLFQQHHIMPKTFVNVSSGMVGGAVCSTYIGQKKVKHASKPEPKRSFFACITAPSCNSATEESILQSNHADVRGEY